MSLLAGGKEHPNYYNWAGLNEKWVSLGNEWYYVLPDDGVYLWQGGSGSTIRSELEGNEPGAYKEPSMLVKEEITVEIVPVEGGLPGQEYLAKQDGKGTQTVSEGSQIVHLFYNASGKLNGISVENPMLHVQVAHWNNLDGDGHVIVSQYDYEGNRLSVARYPVREYRVGTIQQLVDYVHGVQKEYDEAGNVVMEKSYRQEGYTVVDRRSGTITEFLDGLVIVSDLEGKLLTRTESKDGKVTLFYDASTGDTNEWTYFASGKYASWLVRQKDVIQHFVHYGFDGKVVAQLDPQRSQWQEFDWHNGVRVMSAVYEFGSVTGPKGRRLDHPALGLGHVYDSDRLVESFNLKTGERIRYEYNAASVLVLETRTAIDGGYKISTVTYDGDGKRDIAKTYYPNGQAKMINEGGVSKYYDEHGLQTSEIAQYASGRPKYHDFYKSGELDYRRVFEDSDPRRVKYDASPGSGRWTEYEYGADGKAIKVIEYKLVAGTIDQKGEFLREYDVR